MADPNEGWVFEPADPSVGIFGESVYHEPCQAEEYTEAELYKASQVTDDDWVVFYTTFRCPNCGATTEVSEKEPIEMFMDERNEED